MSEPTTSKYSLFIPTPELNIANAGDPALVYADIFRWGTDYHVDIVVLGTASLKCPYPAQRTSATLMTSNGLAKTPCGTAGTTWSLSSAPSMA